MPQVGVVQLSKQPLFFRVSREVKYRFTYQLGSIICCLFPFVPSNGCLYSQSHFQKMERPAPVRNWKYVHHNRKVSADSMDVSVQSVQSNRSGKFNRFQFKKGDEPNGYSSRDDLRREPIFAFTGRSRDKNHEYSVLSKRSGKDKDSDTSKISDNELILNGLVKETPKRQAALPASPQGAKLKDIMKTVKTMTEEFRRIVTQFSKKYKEMRYEWDRSFKTLLSMQLAQESQAVADLRLQLEKKQQELDQLSRVAFERTALVSLPQAKTNQPLRSPEAGLQKLAISKVEQSRQPESLSRNNTLTDLLIHQHLQPPTFSSPGQSQRQLRRMRQTIRRMHQLLEQ